MRPLDAGTERALLGSLGECAGRLRRDGWAGTFLPMAFGRGARGEDDRVIYDRAFHETMDLAGNPLAGVGPLAPALDGWLRMLCGYRLVIATRLHAAVLAVALGIPTVAVAYERKVAGAFTDLGLERYVVTPDVDSQTLHRAALTAAGSVADFRDAAVRIAGQGQVARDFVGSVLKSARC
jgi:Polysaccharide pyruvyl transferase